MPATTTPSKRCNQCKRELPLTEFHLCRRNRDGLQYHCRKCNTDMMRKRTDYHRAYSERWRAENREHKLAYQREWRKRNRERRLEYQRQWVAANLDKVAEFSAQRRARKRRAMPKWLNPCQLRWISMYYTAAQKLTAETGEVHHVDHIIPLKGKDVRGLHVPWNLRVLPGAENCSKHNTYNPEEVWCEKTSRNAQRTATRSKR